MFKHQQSMAIRLQGIVTAIARLTPVPHLAQVHDSTAALHNLAYAETQFKKNKSLVTLHR